jgi:hypothetical protein
MYIFLERLSHTDVKLLSQALRLTQKLVQGPPSLIAVFPSCPRFPAKLLGMLTLLLGRYRGHLVWKRTTWRGTTSKKLSYDGFPCLLSSLNISSIRRSASCLPEGAGRNCAIHSIDRAHCSMSCVEYARRSADSPRTI